MLYRHELTQTPPAEMEADFEEFVKAPEGVQSFARGLAAGVLEHRGEIDRELELQTAHWRVDRLPVVDRNILRLALYELEWGDDAPAAVVLDEAIEIAKRFGGEESPRFVNGVLDGYLRRTRSSVPE